MSEIKQEIAVDGATVPFSIQIKKEMLEVFLEVWKTIQELLGPSQEARNWVKMP